jgi:hypothetical protein
VLGGYSPEWPRLTYRLGKDDDRRDGRENFSCCDSQDS